jgi:thioester reductase-like protein
VGQRFRNTYEQTKAEAEALVRSRLGSLPGVILRPSIIVGDSRTGVTSSFKMMYWPLKIYSRRLWRTVPGYPDAVLDIVPVDYVARAVAQLASTKAPWEAPFTYAPGLAAAPPSSVSRGARRSTSKCASRAMSIRKSSSLPCGRCCLLRCGGKSAACCD